MSTATSHWDTEVTKGTNGGGKYETCPQGNHPGTVVGLFHIGTHEKERDDHTKYQTQELVFLFELIEEKEDGSPFIMGLRCTKSMNDRSTLYDMACSVLNESFPENASFDPRRLLGQPCQVQVVHKAGSKGDAIYANIASKGVKGFPRKMTPPKPVHEWVVWSILDGTPCPEEKWMPLIYGKSIAQLASESLEAKKLAREAADERIAY